MQNPGTGVRAETYEETDMTQADRHNRVALDIVRAIVTDTIASGGDGADCFYLLETVCVGTLSVLGRPGADGVMVDRLAGDLKRRLSDRRLTANRLTACETVGSA